MSETEAEKRGESWCLCLEWQVKYSDYDSMCRHEEMRDLHRHIRWLQVRVEELENAHGVESGRNKGVQT